MSKSETRVADFASALGPPTALVENSVLARSVITPLPVLTPVAEGIGDPNAVNLGVGGA